MPALCNGLDEEGLVVSKKSIPAPIDFASMKDYDGVEVPGNQVVPLLTSEYILVSKHDSRCLDVAVLRSVQ